MALTDGAPTDDIDVTGHLESSAHAAKRDHGTSILLATGCAELDERLIVGQSAADDAPLGRTVELRRRDPRTAMRRAVVTVLSILAMIGAVLVVAEPAQAAGGNGWVYISLPTWLNNCPSGGAVRYPRVAVGATWSGGDYGDDLVYAFVVLNTNQTVSGQGLCYFGSTYGYPGPAFSQTIRPTRNNQTWWVGPGGVRHN
jgi:hypothetical protein